MATRYIRAGAGGANNGTDWTNAYSSIPGSLIRGDMYYVAAGSYGTYTFDDALSGVQTITLRKATVADHGTETGWDDSYGTSQATFTAVNFSTGYNILDGNGSLFDTYGFKVNVPTGTGLPAGTNILSAATNCTIKHTHYQVASANERTGIRIPSGGAAGFWSYNVRLTDFGDDPYKISGQDKLIEYSWIERRNTSDDAHADAFALSSTSGDPSTIRWCLIDWDGQQIFFDGTGTNSHGPWYIYGNVCFGGPNSGKGIWAHSTDPTIEMYVYNNTFVNLGTASISAGSNSTGEAYNNLFYDCPNPGWGGLTHNYSWFETGMSTGGEANAQSGSDPFTSLAGEDYTLAASTDAGTSLAAPYNTDLNEETRGADGTWDRGAYEFTDGGGGAEPTRCALWVRA